MTSRDTLALLSLLCAAGCDGGGDEGGGGTVAAPWTEHCVATFTADYTFRDGFGDIDLRVSAGDAYLLSRLDEFADRPRAEILFLTGRGPIDYPLDLEPGETLPFESNCSLGEGVRMVGAFADVTIYEDEALTTALCSLTTGTTVRSGYSFQLRSDLLADDKVYEVEAAGLGEVCDGATRGFVLANEVVRGDTTYAVLPLGSFLTPPVSE